MRTLEIALGLMAIGLLAALSPQALFAVATSPTPPVPEPSSIVLLGTGIAGLAAFGFKKRSSKKH